MFRYAVPVLIFAAAVMWWFDAPATSIIHNPETIQRMTYQPMALMPHPTGSFTSYNNPAAYGWQDASTTPWHVDGVIVDGKRVLFWPILAYYEGNPVPIILFYWEGRWRNSSGNVWRGPNRWAYVRHTEEEWSEALQQHVLPKPPWLSPTDQPPVNPQPKPVSKSLRYIVDGLKIRYTTHEILQAMDESPFNEPEEGAPLPTASASPQEVR